MKLGRFLFLALTFVASPAAGQPTATADTRDLPEFQRTIDEYATLHQSLIDEVGGLKVTAKPAEITAASDRLAAAIQRARPRAQQGDFFSEPVRLVLVQRIKTALQGQDLAAVLEADKAEERSTIRGLKTYSRFPTDGPLATMPPSVLDVLPPLPEFLEYRFVGSDLILRDRDARLVLDWIKGVVPAR